MNISEKAFGFTDHKHWFIIIMLAVLNSTKLLESSLMNVDIPVINN